jgi:hypothetical protein
MHGRIAYLERRRKRRQVRRFRNAYGIRLYASECILETLNWIGLVKVESRQGGKQTTKMAAAGSRDLALATYTLVSVG